jgi:hypothetical protein
MIRCNVCGTHFEREDNSNIEICEDCHTAIASLKQIIVDLNDFLKNAPPKTLEKEYSNTLSYFITVLSSYNRYVNVKNMIQEIIMEIIRIQDGEKIYKNDIENDDPINNPALMNLLKQNDLLEIAFDNESQDYEIIPKEKLKRINIIMQNYKIEEAGYKNYLKSLLLYVMLLMIDDDINSIINIKKTKKFPRKGFILFRIIAGAINRDIKDSNSVPKVFDSEIDRSFVNIGVKGKTNVLTILWGFSFEASSIFKTPKNIDDEELELTDELGTLVKYIAQRFRERIEERNRSN